MTAPRRTSGRRDPSLLTAGPEIEEPIVEHQDETEQVLPGSRYLFDGDVVTQSVTLAIDLVGDGRTSFIGYKATTQLQEGEDFPDLYARLAQVVNQGVLTAVDDTTDSLLAYLSEQQEKLAVITG